MSFCAIKQCKNYRSKNNNITFHIFPRNPVIAEKWTEIVRTSKNQPMWKPKRKSSICSAHFFPNDEYISTQGTRKIKKGAIPIMDVGLDVPMDFTFAKETHTIALNSIKYELSETGPKTQFLNIRSKIETKEEDTTEEDTTKIDATKEDTTKEDTINKLQKVLLRKTKIISKQRKKLKSLQGKYRYLQKANLSLKYIIKSLKQRYTNNDMHSVLCENSFAANLDLEERKENENHKEVKNLDSNICTHFMNIKQEPKQDYNELQNLELNLGADFIKMDTKQKEENKELQNLEIDFGSVFKKLEQEQKEDYNEVQN